MFDSLRARLLLSHALIVVICLSCVTLALFVLLRPVAERALISDLSAIASVQLAAADDLAAGGPVSLDQAARLARAASRRSNVRVLLLDEQYRVLADVDANTAGRRSLVGVDLAGRWETEPLPGEGPEQSGTFPEPGRPGVQWYFVLAPWPAPDGSSIRYAAFARLSSRFPLLILVSQRLLPEVLAAGLIALGISTLLAVVITNWVARPLQAMAAGAHAIAQGQYGHTVPASGPAEVREVSAAFNQMSGEVRRAQHAQRDFVANVSHELKTPLTSIQGFSQAILDGAAGDQQGVQHAAGVIHDEAERLRRLADDLLELARLDAGQIKLQHEPVDLAAILRVCGERLTLRAQAAGVTLALDLPPELPPVLGDGDRLAQVFGNLLDNALEHTPAGGRITVTAAAAARTVDVAVVDNGTGIPADALPRIFERFYQVDRSRQRGSGGAGLGLAIVRELVQAHGGTITAESVEGLGTRFTVSLPKSPEQRLKVVG